MASPQHVALPVGAYLSPAITCTPEQVEKTTRIKWALQFSSPWSSHQKKKNTSDTLLGGVSHHLTSITAIYAQPLYNIFLILDFGGDLFASSIQQINTPSLQVRWGWVSVRNITYVCACFSLFFSFDYIFVKFSPKIIHQRVRRDFARHLSPVSSLL